MTRKRPAPEPSVQASRKSASRQNTSKTANVRNQQPTRRRPPPFRLQRPDAPTERLRVFVFGEGSAGELGLGFGKSKNVLDVAVPRLNHNLDPETVGVVNLATGGMHVLALTHDNKVLSWGVNDLGALGRDTEWDGGLRDMDAAEDADSDGSDAELNPKESSPTAIAADMFGGATIIQVAAGDSSSFALTSEGFVYGWGTFRDDNGNARFSRTSDGDLIDKQDVPTLIPQLRNIIQLATGNDFCVALDESGEVYTWGGHNEQHQLGRRILSRRRAGQQNDPFIPHALGVSKHHFVSIHAGTNHAFAIDQAGETWVWGMNNFAQTGIRQGAGLGGTSIVAPKRVKSLPEMSSIGGGSHHSIGISRDGRCLVWGRMDGNQLGIDFSQLPLDDPKKVVSDGRGKPRILLDPTALPFTQKTICASAGTDHNVVVTDDGKAWVWGFNANLQCGTGFDKDVPVATALQADSLQNEKLCWAGAGGQYSMVAGSVHHNSTRLAMKRA